MVEDEEQNARGSAVRLTVDMGAMERTAAQPRRVRESPCRLCSAHSQKGPGHRSRQVLRNLVPRHQTRRVPGRYTLALPENVANGGLQSLRQHNDEWIICRTLRHPAVPVIRTVDSCLPRKERPNLDDRGPAARRAERGTTDSHDWLARSRASITVSSGTWISWRSSGYWPEFTSDLNLWNASTRMTWSRSSSAARSACVLE